MPPMARWSKTPGALTNRAPSPFVTSDTYVESPTETVMGEFCDDR